MAEKNRSEVADRYWLVRHASGKLDIPLVPREVAEQYEREGWMTEPLLAAREIEGEMDEEDVERLRTIAAVIEKHADYIGADEDAHALRKLARRIDRLGYILREAEG